MTTKLNFASNVQKDAIFVNHSYFASTASLAIISTQTSCVQLDALPLSSRIVPLWRVVAALMTVNSVIQMVDVWVVTKLLTLEYWVRLVRDASLKLAILIITQELLLLVKEAVLHVSQLMDAWLVETVCFWWKMVNVQLPVLTDSIHLPSQTPVSCVPMTVLLVLEMDYAWLVVLKISGSWMQQHLDAYLFKVILIIEYLSV